MSLWVAGACDGAEYLLKADDDVWVTVPLLVATLDRLTPAFQLGGRLVTALHPQRDRSSKYYVGREFRGQQYPPVSRAADTVSPSSSQTQGVVRSFHFLCSSCPVQPTS